MSMIGKIVFAIIIAMFVLMGIILSFGKGSFLIAGYNMMSAEEKKQYDEKALCKFMGAFMFIIAFGVLLMGLSEFLVMKVLFNIGLGLIIASIAFVIIYTSTFNGFKKK